MDHNQTRASEDAGERWYQLIQSDDDLRLIVRALHDRANGLRKLATGRKFSGLEMADARQAFRTEADQCAQIAARAAPMAFPKPAYDAAHGGAR